MKRPDDHPLRAELNDEVHARPPEALVAPASITYLALLHDKAQGDGGFAAVCTLAERYRVAGPFATMNVGGAYVEAFLVVAMPFLLAQRHGKTRTK